jgi:hypothetical protein
LGLVLLLACSEEAVEAPDLVGASDTEVESDAPTGYRPIALALAGELSAGNIGQHIETLAADDMEGRDNLSEGGARARSYLIEQMTEIGLATLSDNSYERPFNDGVNLVGLIPGQDDSLGDELVLISAHYDHLGQASDPESQCSAVGDDDICNGASDNAAGTAVVLEIARVIAASDVPRRRLIAVVFWDAEEDGLLGSRHFVDSGPFDLEDIVGMFSIDSVGTRIIPGADSALALGMDYSRGLRELIHANNEALGTVVYPVSMNFDGGEGGRSDHKPFQEEGVPVGFFGSGSSPEYHTPADEPAVVDTELALMLARNALVTTLDLSNQDSRPEFLDEREPHIDDAVALRDLGELVLADPEAVGLTDDALVGLLQDWVDDLNAYIDDPPETEAEWATYQSLIDTILTAVYAFLG